MIEGVDAQFLLADRGYDANEILGFAREHGMEAVIPAKRNRREPRHHDTWLYRFRHRIENTSLTMKRWRSIATRYSKTASSFLGEVQVRCIEMWCKALARLARVNTA